MADFEWFRSFVAIYRLGSVSAAAHYRHMTQPALSQHLAALEAEIGEPLFRRTPRQMVPTEKAKMLYSQIVHAVDRLDKVSSQFLHGPSTPTVRIGAPAEFFHEAVIPRWNRPHLDLDLEVQFGLTKPLLQQLKDGELDLVIATQHIATGGLVFQKLAEETFLLVGDQAHLERVRRESAGGSVREALENLRWISYGADMPIIRRFWFRTFHTRQTMRPSHVVPDLRIIRDMVKSGLGVSVLPDYLVKEDIQSGRLHELYKGEPVVNDLWLVCRSADADDPVIGAAAQALLSLKT